jgi:uncharacterized protein YdaU (DUF1376 family)
LIGHYWVHGGLPDDDAALRRITLTIDPRVWRKMKPVLQAFFHDGWHHVRLDKEIARAGFKRKPPKLTLIEGGK